MISFIIPAYNEERFLPRLLSSLSQQKGARHKYEVIVVDGNSTDNTSRVVKSYQKKLDLSFTSTKTRNTAHQRNLGIKKAKGAWIIFIDADNTLPADFVKNFDHIIEADSCDIGIFAIKPAEEPFLYRAVFNVVDRLVHMWSTFGISMQHGGVIAIKKSHIKHAFDTEVRILEDYIFVEKNTKAGARYKYIKKPYYMMSYRRFEKEGLLKTLFKSALYVTGYLIFGKRYILKAKYTMEGGSYYE